MEFPIKLIIEVSADHYNIEQYPRGVTVTEDTIPITIMTRRSIGVVEEYVGRGRDEMDLYEEIRQVSEPIFILKGLEGFGFASFPQLAEVFKKVDEDRWEDITDEERSQVEKDWKDALEKEWVLTWTPADVKWSPEATKDREIFHAKYSYDTLMTMKADEVKDIAKVKVVSPAGTKDEIARRIHQHDFGEEEVGETLERIDKLMTTIGDHRRVEPEKVEKPEEVPLPSEGSIIEWFPNKKAAVKFVFQNQEKIEKYKIAELVTDGRAWVQYVPKPGEKIEVEIPAKPCPECGRTMTPQKGNPYLQVCEHCGKGWNVIYDPPQLYWEKKKPKEPEKAYTVEELKRKAVPEEYISEITSGTRDRIKEYENKVCPHCGSSVKLGVWPDFICEKGHKINVNFLVNFLEDRAEEVEAEKPEEPELRHPSGSTVPELVKPGDTVMTNYETGPYVVEEVAGPWVEKGVSHYSLVLSEPGAERTKTGELPKSYSYSYINELVAVDGRLLKLHKANTDEVFVTKRGKRRLEEFAPMPELPSPGEGVAITGPTETFPYWVKISLREMFAFPTMYDLLTFLKEHKGKGEIKVHQNATTDIPFIMGQVEKMKRGEKLDEEKWSKTTPKPLEVQEKEFAEIKPEKPEEQVKLTPENIEWAIDETLTHYAEDWLKLSVRALLEEGKRDEALKFLREHCRWFGVASAGKPYVSGSEKGILITSAITSPEETKLVTWVELLKRVEAEKIKKLEEF